MAVATVDTSRKIPDFPEYFEVNPAVAAGSPDLKAVQDCISELKQFIDYLGTLPVAKISVLLAAQAAVVEAKRPLRTQIMANLRKIADMFCAEEISPAEATHQVIMEQGRYDAGKERIEQFLFVVGEKFENDKAVDLLIRAHSGTATKVVTPEKEKLFVDLTNTLTVIRTACDRIHRRDQKRADALVDEFVRKLAGIGRVGLQGDHASLAAAALESTKAEFYAREAGTLKNNASRALGWWSSSMAILLIALYLLCRWVVDVNLSTHFNVSKADLMNSFFYVRKEFFLLAAGAAIGTWLSFTVRSLDLTFSDLGKLEDEFLGPGVRVAFVVGFTITLGLVFWTSAFTISVGDMKVARPISGATALLVGAFCGLSERALATAISSRAAAFVKGVGGP